MSPTQRSLKYLRDQGFMAQVVEKFNTFAKVRIDLFGFIDIIAVKDGVTLAVQTTSGPNLAARRNKLVGDPGCNVAVKKCLAAGWKIFVHGWAKHKIIRGGKAYRFELNSVEIRIDDVN